MIFQSTNSSKSKQSWISSSAGVGEIDDTHRAGATI